MGSSIDEILASRRKVEEPEATEGDKFFLLLSGDKLAADFLEVQFSDGMRTCFSYQDLIFFNYDPAEGCIDLEFGGYMVVIMGRGLAPRLFEGIKAKRIEWIREADQKMQDHNGNETFIEKIRIILPKDQAANPEEP